LSRKTSIAYLIILSMSTRREKNKRGVGGTITLKLFGVVEDEEISGSGETSPTKFMECALTHYPSFTENGRGQKSRTGYLYRNTYF